MTGGGGGVLTIADEMTTEPKGQLRQTLAARGQVGRLTLKHVLGILSGFELL